MNLRDILGDVAGVASAIPGPWQAPAAAVSAGLSLFGGHGSNPASDTANAAQNQANQYYSQQSDLARQEAQRQQALYAAASPYYGGSLGTLFSNAGYGQPAGSIYDQPQQAAQLRQAQNDLSQGYAGQAQQMRHQFNLQGIGNSATTAAALARLTQGQQQNFADFRNNMAINAVNLQNQRLGQALSAAGLGLGASTLGAANQFHLLGGVAQNQANLASGLAGQAAGANSQSGLLQQLLQAFGQGGGSYGALGNTNFGVNHDLGGDYSVSLPF